MLLSNPTSFIMDPLWISIKIFILSIIHFHHSRLRILGIKDHAHLRACLHCDEKLRGLDVGFPAVGASSNQLCWPRKSKGLRLLAVSLALLLLSVSFADGFRLILFVAFSRIYFFFSPSFLVYSPVFSISLLISVRPLIFSFTASLYSPEQCSIRIQRVDMVV